MADAVASSKAFASVDEPDRLEGVPRRLLVVATASVPADALRTSVRAHAGEEAEMLVVAPASA
jgi:hypothetical protein